MKTYRLAAILLLTLGLVGGLFGQQYQNMYNVGWMAYNSGNWSNGRFPWAIATGDLNGDTYPDVVVAQWPWATGFAVLLNQGNGTFRLSNRYASAKPPLDIAMADFDGDGDLDVVVSNSGSNYEGTTISLFRNQGNGTFAAQEQFAVGTQPVGLAVADFDSNGTADLAVANNGYLNQGNTVSLLRNNGSGGFLPAVTYAAGSGPYKLAAGDLNGDGRPDLAIARAGQKVSVMLNQGGTFGNYVEYNVLSPIGTDAYQAIALADVDRDGDLDAVYASTGTSYQSDGAIALLRNQGNGTFSATEPLIGATGVAVAIKDITGDTWPDIVTTTMESHGWNMFTGNGSGGFLSQVRRPAGESPLGTAIVDVDRDGDLDVLTLDNYSMAVTVHYNPGNGQFPTIPTFPIQGISLFMDAADIDSDGDLDIVTSGGTTSGAQGSILRNQGNGVFNDEVVYGVTGGVAFTKLRDLNGDGHPDILFAHASPSYNFYVAMNNGNGTFGTPLPYAVPSCGSGDIDAFDIDNDGDLDVCFVEGGGCPGVPESFQRIFISKNNGNGTFQPPYYVMTNLGPYAIVGGDFNGDGNIDLATADYGVYGSGTTVSVLLGNGDGTFQGFQTYVVVGGGPEDIVAADLNGDNILDLATCNTGSGGSGVETMSVLLGNGNGTFQQAVTYDGSYSYWLLGTVGIAAGDIDHDGDKDLMVGNYGSNDISIYVNRGNGQFDFTFRYGVDFIAISPFFADFTGDGIKDIAVVTHGQFALDNAVAIVAGRGTTEVTEGGGKEIPTSFSLMQNYPNPFNPTTAIRFEVPQSGFVSLKVFDVLGREVATLVNEEKSPGSYSVRWDAATVGSGTYFARLESNGRREIRRMLLMK